MKWRPKSERAMRAGARKTALLARPGPQPYQPWVGPRTQVPEYVDRVTGKIIRGSRLRRYLDKFAP